MVAPVTPDWRVRVLALVPFLNMIAPARDEAVPRVSDEAPDRARVVPIAAPMSGVVRVSPARVSAAEARLIATWVVPI